MASAPTSSFAIRPGSVPSPAPRDSGTLPVQQWAYGHLIRGHIGKQRRLLHHPLDQVRPHIGKAQLDHAGRRCAPRCAAAAAEPAAPAGATAVLLTAPSVACTCQSHAPCLVAIRGCWADVAAGL